MTSFRQDRLFLIALFALASVVFCSASQATSLPENKPGVGDPAPAFIINDLNGNKVSISEIVQSGKVVFLNFWGLRCSSCIEEIGYLNPLFDKYSSKGVVFVGVNVDGVKPDMIKKMMPNMPNVPKFTVIPDPEFKVPDMFNMAGAPLSLVIGKDGVVKYRHEDFKPGDEAGMEAAIAKALSAN
jgi:peroxiredoxin